MRTCLKKVNIIFLSMFIAVFSLFGVATMQVNASVGEEFKAPVKHIAVDESEEYLEGTFVITADEPDNRTVQLGIGSTNGVSGTINGKIIIPETVDFNGTKYTVTYISNAVFYYRSGLSDIELPKSIKKIGSKAFGSCYGLSEIKLPEGLEIIEDSAFDGCFNLNIITIPKSVTTIESRAFTPCNKLSSCVLTGDTLPTIAADAFTDVAADFQIYYPTTITGGSVQGVTSGKKIDNSITEGAVVEIKADVSPEGKKFKEWKATSGDVTFADKTKSTTTFTMTDKVVKIEAVYEDVQIGDVFKEKIQYVLTDGTIKEYDCQFKITNAEAGNYTVQVGPDWVATVQILEQGTLVIPEKVSHDGTAYTVTAIADNAFGQNAQGILQIDLPDTLTSIGESAFQSVFRMEHFEIPVNMKTIKQDAFLNCSGLKSIEIPYGLETLDNQAFKGCDSLEKVMIITDKDEYDDHMDSLIENIKAPNPTISLTRYLGSTLLEAKQPSLMNYGEKEYQLDDLITVPTVYKYNDDGTREKSSDFQLPEVTYQLQKKSRSSNTRLDTVNKKLYIDANEEGTLILSATYEGRTVFTEIKTTPVALDSIQIKTNPTQLEYREGDVFNPDGLIITEKYNNGHSKDIAYADEKASFSYDQSKLKTGDQQVTMTYQGKEIDVEISVLRQSFIADSQKNLITGLQKSYIKGDTVTFQAKGDHQDNISPIKGDQRYIPIKWIVDEEGSFDEKGEASFSTAFMKTGTQRIVVVYQLEEYDGSEWIQKGVDTKTQTIDINEKTDIVIPKIPNQNNNNPSNAVSTNDETGIGMLIIGLLGAGSLIVTTKRKKYMK